MPNKLITSTSYRQHYKQTQNNTKFYTTFTFKTVIVINWYLRLNWCTKTQTWSSSLSRSSRLRRWRKTALQNINWY